MNLNNRLTRLEASNGPDKGKMTVFSWGIPELGTNYSCVIGHRSQGHHRQDFSSDKAFMDAIDAEHIEAHGCRFSWREDQLFDDGSKNIQPDSTAKNKEDRECA